MATPLTIKPETRRLGGKIIGPRGSQKTLYASFQTYRDLEAGIGSIVLDPLGALSGYFLARVIGSGKPKLWDRICYIPVGGMPVGEEVWLLPTPFLYNRTGKDSLQTQSSRVVEMWRRLSPNQENAPIQGMPSIERTANYAGMLLGAMGNQLVPDAASLLREPARWQSRIEAVRDRYPDELTQPATYFLKTYPTLRDGDKQSQTLSFQNKIDPYVLNQKLAAQYGANAWGIDLPIVERGVVLLFDFQYLAEEERRVGLTWLFTRCMEYFRHRGPRRDVVGFVIDELSRFVSEENRFLEADFLELIQLGRNVGVAPFVTYQEVTQVSEGMQRAMNQLGYSLYGAANDPEAAARLTRNLNSYRPYWEKATEPVYVRGNYDHDRMTYFSPQEQELLNGRHHRQRQGGTFALAIASKEGNPAHPVGRISTAAIRDTQLWPDQMQELITETKRRLVMTHGRSVNAITAEITQRQPPEPEAPIALPAPSPKKPTPNKKPPPRASVH